jgi:ABC-2 type transport system permease protein
MAVYEQTYRAYDGPLTPEKSRFLVLPRYGLQEAFSSKLFLAFFVVCFLPSLGAAAIIWVLHNSTFLEFAKLLFGGQAPQLEIGATFFYGLQLTQGVLAMLMTLLAAPPLIAADLNNNGLPLYLSRPFSRGEYVAGKLSILLFLLSSMTWVPLLSLLLLQGFQEKGWFAQHGGLMISVLLGSWVWILVLALAGLAVSATVKWKPIARVALFGVFFFSWVVAKFFNNLFNRSMDLPWGDVLSPISSIRVVWQHLFEIRSAGLIPPWAAWSSLLLLCGLCLLLLARRVRAYEVVK